MNESAVGTAIEFVTSPLIPQFLLIQEVGLTLTMVFLLMMYRTMLKLDDQSYEEIFTPWMVIAVGFFLISTAYLTYTWGIERILFAFALSTAITLGVLRPIFGLSAFLAFLLYRPWELMPDPIVLAIPKYFGLMVVGFFLLKKFNKREFFLIWNKECTFLLFFAAWVLVSTVKTPNLNEAVASFEAQFSRPLIIFFLVVNLIKTPLDFLTVKITFVITVVTKGIVAMYNTMAEVPGEVTQVGEEAGKRLVGIGALADSNDLAAVFIIALPFLLALFFRYRKTALTSLMGTTIFIFSTYMIWMTRSRGAIIALLALMGSYVFNKIKRASTKFLIISLVALMFFPITLTFKRSSDDLSESSSNRMNYWKTAVVMALKNPLLGVGYNAYPANFEKYAPELISEFGHRTAHSTWFLILGETGMVGFLLFLCLYFSIFKKAWELRNRQPDIFYSCIGYTVTMTFLSHAYLIYPYLLFSFISVAHRVFPAEEEVEALELAA